VSWLRSISCSATNLSGGSRIRLIWANAVYTGKLATWAANLKMTTCIVARHNP
jgi:hypothetical protein